MGMYGCLEATSLQHGAPPILTEAPEAGLGLVDPSRRRGGGFQGEAALPMAGRCPRVRGGWIQPRLLCTHFRCGACCSPSATRTPTAALSAVRLCIYRDIPACGTHAGGKSLVSEVLLIRQLLRHLSGHRMKVNLAFKSRSLCASRWDES